MSCKNTLYSCILALHAHTKPHSHETLQHFRGERHRRLITKALQVTECGGYWGWTRSRLAVWRLLPALCPPRASTNHIFSASPERLLQRLAIAQSAIQNRREPAKQLIWTQQRAEMGDLHAAGSHPAQKLGLCAAHKAPGHHQGSPSCAHGAGKGRVSGLVI